MPPAVMILIVAVVFGGLLFYAIGNVKKAAKFLTIYNTTEKPKDDDYDSPVKTKRVAFEKPKHSRKVMILALLKYLGILFLFVLVSTINTYMVMFMVPAWIILLYCTFHYIKMWKYHEYSVFLWIFIVLAVIAGAAALSQQQFFKDAMEWLSSFVRTGGAGRG